MSDNPWYGFIGVQHSRCYPMRDTQNECAKRKEKYADYIDMLLPAHYPVPAIRLEIDRYPMLPAIFITEIGEGTDNGVYWMFHDNVVAWDDKGRF